MAGWLHWHAPADRPLRRWFVIFFAPSGIGALLGGITHGFLPDTQSTIYHVIWSATLLAIGIAGLSSWGIGARLLSSKTAAKQILTLAGSLFAMYAVTVLLLSQSFAVAIVYYVPAAVFLLISFVLTYLRRPRNYLVAGIAGLALSFAAASIQQTETGIVSLGLNHNALYHLVQAAVFLLIFLAARGLMWEAACERDATS